VTSPARNTLPYATHVGSYAARGRYRAPALLLIGATTMVTAAAGLVGLLMVPSLPAVLVVIGAAATGIAVLHPLSHPPPRFRLAVPILCVAVFATGFGTWLCRGAIEDANQKLLSGVFYITATYTADVRWRDGLQMLFCLSLPATLLQAAVTLYAAARARNTTPMAVLPPDASPVDRVATHPADQNE
jgi:hypothetical protein